MTDDHDPATMVALIDPALVIVGTVADTAMSEEPQVMAGQLYPRIQHLTYDDQLAALQLIRISEWTEVGPGRRACRCAMAATN